MHVRARDEERDPEIIELHRVIFPVELAPPPGFSPERLSTWPNVDGRLELVEGRLLFMPPTGRAQSQTVADVVGIMSDWGRTRPEFSIHTNEAGMKLGDDVRAADAAIWRVSDLPDDPDLLVRLPPLLAVEVAGRDDSEVSLRAKAAWYLAHGVATVWLVLPATRQVVVLSSSGELRCVSNDRLPPPSELDGLTPIASELFRQAARSKSGDPSGG